MEEKEERWGVKLNNGVFYPGFNSQEEAEQEIKKRADWQNIGGKAVPLSKKEKGVEKGGE